MSNAVFCKTMENVRKHRDITLVTTEARRTTKGIIWCQNQIIIQKIFFRKFISHRNEKQNKTQAFMNKPIYLGVSIVEISKIVVCEFWYDYVKQKQEEKAKLYYMDTDNLIV